MAATLLTELAAQGRLPQRYSILEVSADLAARQRARLAQLPPGLRERVVWLERLPERPPPGLILANEVADAPPCRRFTCRAPDVRELGVAPREGAREGGRADPLAFRQQDAAAHASL